MKRVFFLFWVVLIITSCRREPLYDADSSVYLKLNLRITSNITLATPIDNLPADLRSKVEGRTPERMQVNFYDCDTHALVSKTFVGADGGFIEVAPGTYDLIVYSIDSDVSQVENGNSRGSVCATTSQAGSYNLPQAYDNSQNMQKGLYVVMNEPDHIYVGRKNNVTIPEHSVADETINIYVDAQTLLDTYMLRITQVSGIENIASAKVYITGQAQAKALWDSRYLRGQVAILSNCYTNPAQGELFTVFNTFGKYPNATNNIFLTVELTNASGDKREYVFDVTDQFDNPDNTDHIIEVSDPIDVPDSGSDSGGFKPDVDDWDEEHKDIDI